MNVSEFSDSVVFESRVLAVILIHTFHLICTLQDLLPCPILPKGSEKWL